MLEQRWSTQNDVVGHFIPQSQYLGFGPAVWSCTQNNHDCGEPNHWGSIRLEANEPTDWRFAIDAEARPTEQPYDALAVVELPGTDFFY